MIKHDSRFYDNRTAAQYLNFSPRTLEKFRVHGGGPVFRKFGRRVLYAIEDLEDMPEFHSENLMATTELVFEKLVELGREITRLVAEAEADGDILRVDLLLREKDRINRMRSEISHAGC